MKPNEISNKRILISPLNWGYGHVSRCIPLVENLIKQNNDIFIACDQKQKVIFDIYFFGKFTFIEHKGYPFDFNGKGLFFFDLLKKSNQLYRRYIKELKDVKEYQKIYSLDLIISDHRYGLRLDSCTSIFLTHQLHLPLPWYGWFFQWFHKIIIGKFDFQWIVDDYKTRLAGELSSKKGYENAKYIGALSRFSLYSLTSEFLYKGVLIISGPEAYASSLLEGFRWQIEAGDIDLILGPINNLNIIKEKGYKHLFRTSESWVETDQILLKTKKVYGYFGYTTLMDVKFLNCQYQLIPCKGQLEQMYLSKLHS